MTTVYTASIAFYGHYEPAYFEGATPQEAASKLRDALGSRWAKNIDVLDELERDIVRRRYVRVHWRANDHGDSAGAKRRRQIG